MSARANKNDTINIHPSIRFPLSLLQILGYFPLTGVWNSNHRFLTFSWFSFQILYSVFWFIWILLLAFVETYKLFLWSVTLPDFSHFVFVISGLFANIFFINLSRHWPQIISVWHNLEILMGTAGIKTNLKKRLKDLTLIFLTIVIVEQILLYGYLIIDVFRPCECVEDHMKIYFVGFYSVIFSFVNYAPWKAIFLQLILIRTAFSVTYPDIFIILISKALVLRIKQIRYKLETHLRTKSNNAELWINLRNEHYRLYKLSRFIDDKLTYMIFLSYGTNLYLMLIQLFGIMRRVKSTLRKIYYCLSFGVAALRSVNVTLFGANVTNESRKILPLLLSVPSSLYNKEIECFINQVIDNEIYLSGRNFFKITRGLLLRVAATIVIYELALIQSNLNTFQFDDNEEDSGSCSTVCNKTY